MGNAVQRWEHLIDDISSIKIVFNWLIICVLEKYELVGRLLKAGEQPTNYSDEEDEPGSSDKSGGEEKHSEKDDKKPEE